MRCDDDLEWWTGKDAEADGYILFEGLDTSARFEPVSPEFNPRELPLHPHHNR
jgi:hypothetical protein